MPSKSAVGVLGMGIVLAGVLLALRLWPRGAVSSVLAPPSPVLTSYEDLTNSHFTSTPANPFAVPRMRDVPDTKALFDRGDVVSELKRCGVHREGESQMKIHSKILQGAEGHLYFVSMEENMAGPATELLDTRGLIYLTDNQHALAANRLNILHLTAHLAGFNRLPDEVELKVVRIASR